MYIAVIALFIMLVALIVGLIFREKFSYSRVKEILTNPSDYDSEKLATAIEVLIKKYPDKLPGLINNDTIQNIDSKFAADKYQCYYFEFIKEYAANIDDLSPLLFRVFQPYYLKCLLMGGADPNIKDEYGNTPLHNELYESIDWGSKIYEDHKTRNPETVKVLLLFGADVNIKNIIKNNKQVSPFDIISRVVFDCPVHMEEKDKKDAKEIYKIMREKGGVNSDPIKEAELKLIEDTPREYRHLIKEDHIKQVADLQNRKFDVEYHREEGYYKWTKPKKKKGTLKFTPAERPGFQKIQWVLTEDRDYEPLTLEKIPKVILSRDCPRIEVIIKIPPEKIWKKKKDEYIEIIPLNSE